MELGGDRGSQRVTGRGRVLEVALHPSHRPMLGLSMVVVVGLQGGQQLVYLRLQLVYIRLQVTMWVI